MADGYCFKNLKISISPQWFKGSHQNVVG